MRRSRNATGSDGEAVGQRRVGQHVGDIPGGRRRRSGAPARGRGRSRRTCGGAKLAAIGEARHRARPSPAARPWRCRAPCRARCRDRPAAGRARRRRCAGSTGSAAGPTFSSASTAGTFSDCCRARRTVTAPWWSRSKLRGSQSLEAHRHVLDQRLRMQRAVVERHGVDQRLQRRAGRAMGAHQVDLAGAAEEVAAAQPGHDAAGAVVDHHHRDLRPGRRSGRAPRRRAGASADCSCEADAWSARRCRATGRPARPRDAARASASPAAASGTGRLDRHVEQRAVDHAVLQPARQHAVARRPAPAAGERSGRRRSGDCGMATSRAASAALSCLGSLPK